MTIYKEQLAQQHRARSIGDANADDDSLGKLKHLAGVWQNCTRFKDRGWNMIALPFSDPNAGGSDPRDYRVLANQYNEKLELKTADKGVPNRGVLPEFDSNLDQTLIALDYEQTIRQVAAKDSPVSGKARENEAAAIHHEPGLWLEILNHDEGGFDIARLGTIPHGNSLLAMGRMDEIEPANVAIPEVNPFPFLTSNGQVPLDDPLERYLSPVRGICGTEQYVLSTRFGLAQLTWTTTSIYAKQHKEVIQVLGDDRGEDGWNSQHTIHRKPR